MLLLRALLGAALGFAAGLAFLAIPFILVLWLCGWRYDLAAFVIAVFVALRVGTGDLLKLRAKRKTSLRFGGPLQETDVTYKRGARVTAFRNVDRPTKADSGTAYVFGDGIYLGDEVPPPEIRSPIDGQPLAIPVPKILLDDGAVVWGCECWWTPRQSPSDFQAKGLRVVRVSLREFRVEKDAQLAATRN